MTPVVPSNANVVYSKPIDWDEEQHGPCDDLHVVKADGMITSLWKPDDAELAALVSGGSVLISIISNNLPPMAVGVAARKVEIKSDGPGA